MLKKILMVCFLSVFYQNSIGYELHYTPHNDQSVCRNLYKGNEGIVTLDANEDSEWDLFCATTNVFPLSEGKVEAAVDAKIAQDLDISLLVHKVTEAREDFVVAEETWSWMIQDDIVEPEISVELSENSGDGYVILLVRASDASLLDVKSISFVPVTSEAKKSAVTPALDTRNARTLDPIATIPVSIGTPPTFQPITIPLLNVTENVPQTTAEPVTVPFPNVTNVVPQTTLEPITIPFPNITEIIPQTTEEPVTIPSPNVTGIVTVTIPDLITAPVTEPVVITTDPPTEITTEPPTEQPSEVVEDDSSEGLSTYAIILIAIGSVVGAVILGFVVWHFTCRS